MTSIYGDSEPMLRHSDPQLDDDINEPDDSAGADAAALAHMTRLQERRERPRAASMLTTVKRTLRAAFAELLGSFLLGFFTIYASKMGQTLEGNPLDPTRILFVALVYGCVYGAAVYALSYDGVSGKPNIRQLNPAVSIVLLGTGRMRFVDTLIFVAVQIGGAALAALVAPLCWPAGESMQPSVSLVTVNGQVAGSILIGLLFLLIVVFTFFDRTRVSIRQPDHLFTLQSSPSAPHREQRPQSQHETNCLLALVAAAACAGALSPVTHDYMNPAISLSFGILTRHWHWVPLACPYLAALCAALLARLGDLQLDYVRSVFSDGGGARGGASLNGGAKRGSRRAAAAAGGAGGVQMGVVMDVSHMDDL